jgi:hypothetical protein
MRTYTPDRWVVLKLTSHEDGSVHYRVFGCWFGGFAGSNSWKMNSGITNARFNSVEYIFGGHSGSEYCCDATNYGTHMYGQSIIEEFMKNSTEAGGDVSIMSEDTDWVTFDYSK